MGVNINPNTASTGDQNIKRDLSVNFTLGGLILSLAAKQERTYRLVYAKHLEEASGFAIHSEAGADAGFGLGGPSWGPFHDSG